MCRVTENAPCIEDKICFLFVLQAVFQIYTYVCKSLQGR